MVSWVKSQKYTNRWERKKRLTQVVILQSEVDPNKKKCTPHEDFECNNWCYTINVFFSYLLLKILSMWYRYLMSTCSASPKFSSFSRNLLVYNIAENYLLDYHSCKSKLGRNRADKSVTLRETSCKSRNPATKTQTLLSQEWRWMAI